MRELRHLWSLSGSMTEGHPWPAPGGWALGPEAITAAAHEFRYRRLRTVVELGPGASTLLLHRSLPADVQMWGVEHDATYAERLQYWLEANEISDYTLIHAPLRPLGGHPRTPEWYDVAALSDLPPSIDLLVIDGPPNWRRGANSRAPTWALLRDRLRSGSLVLVDDATRSSERQMVRRWMQDGPLHIVRDGGTFVLLEVR